MLPLKKFFRWKHGQEIEGERYRSYFQSIKTQVKDAIKEKKVLTCKAVSINILKILKFNTQNILSVEF
jgi:hypothetical protein